MVSLNWKEKFWSEETMRILLLRLKDIYRNGITCHTSENTYSAFNIIIYILYLSGRERRPTRLNALGPQKIIHIIVNGIGNYSIFAIKGDGNPGQVQANSAILILIEFPSLTIFEEFI